MSAAESGAVGAAGTMNDALTEVPVRTGNDTTLRLLVDVWTKLPDSVKNQILRLADEAIYAVGSR